MVYPCLHRDQTHPPKPRHGQGRTRNGHGKRRYQRHGHLRRKHDGQGYQVYCGPVIHGQIEDKRIQGLMGKDANQDYASQIINTIDFVSFWVFVTVFLMFNIAYWNSY